MSEHEQTKPGWLEVVSDEKTHEKVAFCPYRDQMVQATVCFACKDCTGLVLSPETRNYYVACERAEKDGLSTEGGADGHPVTVHHGPGCSAEKPAAEPIG